MVENTEISKLNSLLARQHKEINKLSRQIFKIEKSSKTVLNKDKYTFMQTFKRRSNEGGALPYLVDIIGCTPTWTNVTAEKLERFVNYLSNTKSKRTGKAIQPTTQNLYISCVRNVIKWGNTPINDTITILKAHKVEPRKKVWLHPDEIERLYEYKPANYEASTYKAFLICCMIGCRIEDVNNISLSNLDGLTLRYRPIKTRNTECYVRLRQEQINALERLILIKSYGNEPSNEKLKALLKKAGIERRFDVGTYNKVDVCFIADCAHFHTARHTFATIKYRYSDYTDREIALAVGHTDFRQTWGNYICDKSPVTREEKETKGLFI